VTTLRRLAVAAAIAWMSVCMAATPAFAHARLLRTDPAPGSTVGPNLAQVSLQFDDVVKLLPRALLVTGATGAPLTTGAPRVVRGRVLEVALIARLVPGRYYVGWRVLADDGHVESGSFGFVVAAPGGLSATATAPRTATSAGSVPSPQQPTWPVVVAAALAAVAIAGAALVVQRGLTAVRMTPADAYPVRDSGTTPPFDNAPLASGDDASRH